MMRRKICLPGALLLTILLAGSAMAVAQEAAHKAPDPALVERARKLLSQVPLVDGHNDLPWEYRKRFQNHMDKIDLRAGTAKLDPPMHTDIPRLRQGGLGGQFWTVYLPVEMPGAGAVQPGMRRLVMVHARVYAYGGTLRQSVTPAHACG